MAEIKTGDGNDFIKGTSGIDLIDSGGGHDIINAGKGNDLVKAGDGNDVVKAGDGNDRVNGGPGNDLLYGESGSDTFTFEVAHGADRIADFTASDRIELGGGIDAYYAFQNENGDVRLVTLDQTSEGLVKTGSITLVGVDPLEAGLTVSNYADFSTWTAVTPSTDPADNIFFV